MIRICVIGAGMHSRSNHGPSLRDLQREQPHRYALAAICDLDAARAEAYKSDFCFERSYANFHKMIGTEKPDAVIVVSPIDTTVALVEDLLPYGIPLEFEKPPGETVRDAEKLLALIENFDVPHMISFNRRFNPGILAAKRWLANSGNSVDHITARMLRCGR